MHPARKPWIFLFALLGGVCLSAKEQTVPVYAGHSITVDVPENFTFAEGRDPQGFVTVKLADPVRKIDLVISFVPDPQGKVSNDESQRGLVADACRTYAEASVEKSYDFKDLAPHTGSGTYCTFTDASLVRKLPLPPGEYLMVTSGVKAWPGCCLVFTLLSNNLSSDEYAAAMKLVRESCEEQASRPPAKI